MNESFALPHRDPSFLGRSELVDDALPGYLDRADDGVPVVLNGRVGIGKTMVSSELAHRLHSRYADVSWIDVTTAGSGQPAERIAACLTTVHGRTGPHLLVLDGVSDPDDVVRCLPRDETRVLITSRADTGVWHRIAHVVQVPVLPREESVRLLRKRVHGLTEADAMHLAGALDDLPLAMDNAASWLTSGMTPGQVLEQLKSSASRILSGYRSSDFPRSLAGRLSKATSVLAAGAEEDRRMLHLLHALAVLGPAPFPTRALRGDRWEVSDSDAQYLLTICDLHRRLGGLRDRGLVILQTGVARLDEISGAVIRDLLVARPEDEAAAFAMAEQLLVAAVPERAAVEGAWGDWALVTPSVLALDPARVHTKPGRKAILDTYDYLVDSGRYKEVIDSLGNLRTAWEEHFAQCRADELVVMSALARAHFGRGTTKTPSDSTCRSTGKGRETWGRAIPAPWLRQRIARSTSAPRATTLTRASLPKIPGWSSARFSARKADQRCVREATWHGFRHHRTPTSLTDWACVFIASKLPTSVSATSTPWTQPTTWRSVSSL